MLRQPHWCSWTLFAEHRVLPDLQSTHQGCVTHGWAPGLAEDSRGCAGTVPHARTLLAGCLQTYPYIHPPDDLTHGYGNVLLHTLFLLERKSAELHPGHSMKSIPSWSCFQPWEKPSPEDNTRDTADPSHRLPFGVGTLTWMVPTHEDKIRSAWEGKTRPTYTKI